MTFPLNEMFGYSRLCDRLRSSAIIWKQVSLRSSAIYDLRSAIVCDRLRSYGNQPYKSTSFSSLSSALRKGKKIDADNKFGFTCESSQDLWANEKEIVTWIII